MTQIANFVDVRKLLAKHKPRTKKPGSYSLDNMQVLMTKLGNPQDTYKVVHVAGTSGKTSTCYYIAALLSKAGKKVGLTVSPHVDEVNERVQINMLPLSEAKFCLELEKFISITRQFDIELSYFELLVGFAFWEFAQQKVDYAVVEVGLGGLLDGTNVIHSPDKICVITDIGLDHTNVLGGTIDKIAKQKAGIIQDHNPIFMYKQSAKVMEQVLQRCQPMHAGLHVITSKPYATFNERNFFLAKNVYDYIAQNEDLPSANLKASDVNVPARAEEFKYKGKTVIIDGSHNGQKMSALVKVLQKTYPNQSAAVLVSFVDREARRAPEALQQLHKLSDKVFVTTFSGEQDMPNVSVDPQRIAKEASKIGFAEVKTVKKPEEAFEELLKQPEDILIVTGSFYLLNHIRPLILKP